MLGSLADTGLDLIACWSPCSASGSPRCRPTASIASATARPRRWRRCPGRAHHRLRDRHRLARGRPAGRRRSAPRHAEYGIAVSLRRDRRSPSPWSPTSARSIARTGSVAIRTDNVHYQSDLFLNLSVDRRAGARSICRLRAAPIRCSGIGIALWLVWGAWQASSHAVDQLMDREWPEEKRQRFLAVAAQPSRAARASTTSAPAAAAPTISSSSTSGSTRR